MQICFNPRGRLMEATLECEAAIFLHWYGNTKQDLAREYDCYTPQSRFVSVVSGDDVVACCRLIKPGPANLKTLVDIERDPWNVRSGTVEALAELRLWEGWDIATLGVHPAYKIPALTAILYHGVVRACQENQVRTITAILDQRVRRLLAIAGLIMHTIPQTSSQPYLGSPSSTPVYADFPLMLAGQRELNPEAYRQITLGLGLGDVHVPAPSEFRDEASLDEPGPEEAVSGREELLRALGSGAVPRVSA